MDKKQQTIDTYNNSAQALADKFDDLGARVDDVKEGFSYLRKDSPNVLEIGCGNGRDAKEILKYVNSGSYLGIDISEELIKIARKNVSEGKFEIKDIESYSFSRGIDIIFAFASLIHSDAVKLGKIFDKAHESLNKGGIFCISMKYGKYEESTKEDKFGVRTYYFYDKKTIGNLIEGKYEILKEQIHDLNGQTWMEMILRKKGVNIGINSHKFTKKQNQPLFW